ncbi:CDP-glycerol glycerophosphotransferase family protein [Agromyces archimandritae]|uniref:CDP-glycerol glycerophosphotransferase family protein n=1 Tax=Agromyces archimandritae TaxID=2781962 RepID=A0A975FNS4_9MICO|nr:CDP-glycerol glycerophosphotransferase family protein [Agromyces archimandritae]QTX05262.1 CDP-glycerol glycerophosphotransferase family protein [Agromyces archimandritae]
MTDAGRDRQVWLFTAGAAFDGNPKWLFLHVVKHRPDIEAHWLAYTESAARAVRELGFSAMTFGGAGSKALQRRAGVWVVNQVKERIPVELRGATLLNLWHGVGVKKVERGMTAGFLLSKVVEKYVRNNLEYRRDQLFLVTSPAMEDHFRVQIGFEPEQAIRAGYPQNSHEPFSSYDHDLRGRNGLGASTRLLVWAPTYRLRRNETFVTRALPDIPRLIDALERADAMLILKLHPQLAVDRSYQAIRNRYEGHPRLVFWDNADDFAEIMPDIDTAIVDYSSIFYDLLDAGVRKVIRYPFDWGDPDALEPGLDYESLTAGTWAGDFDALLDAIETGDNRIDDADHARLMDMFWAYSDEGSCERIVEHALAYRPLDIELPTLYSFDVFDTVIHRRGVVPESIFHGVRQRMQLSDVAFPGELEARFVTIRRHAERAVREYRRKSPELAASQEFEIQFDDIYERIRELFNLSEEQLGLLKRWELELEEADSFGDAEIIERIAELRDAGETVVFVSDMYLPKPFVERLLAHADPRLADIPLYLSSEQLVQKTTKRLFLRVFTDLHYDFAGWVHTGDSAHADERMPASLSIRTVRTETPAFDEYEQALVDGLDSYDGYLLAGLMRERRVSGGLSDAELFAYRIAAPYLVPYVSWVLADAVRRGYRTLVFISRDGYHMRRVADAIIRERGLALDTGYLYGSRKAWRLASQVDGIDEDTFAPHGSFGGVRSWEGLLGAARASREELLGMFPEFARFDGAEFDGRTAGEIVEALRASAAYREHLERVAAADRELVVDYLRSELDMGGDTAFVEYWGRGYTQDCLARLLGAAAGHPVPTPFYYARSIYPSRGASIRHNFTSETHSLLVIEALFANLPHGSVEGYRREGDRVVPVTPERDCDRELLAAFERMLPEFAVDLERAGLLDRDRLRRDSFAFGFEYFREAPEDPDYLRFVAPLRDAVELGSREREFAPVLTVPAFISYLRGRPMREITRSLPLSLERAHGPAPLLYRLQQRVGFRRVFKRAYRRMRDAFAREDPPVE